MERVDEKKNRNASKSMGNAAKCFLMLEPRDMADSGAIARRIAKCEGVREVHLTSGRYGFVVMAQSYSKDWLGSIGSSVKRASGSKSVSVAVSHMIYR